MSRQFKNKKTRLSGSLCYWKRWLSGFILVTFFLTQTVHVDVALAQISLIEPLTEIYVDEPPKKVSLVAILADSEILDNTESFEGLASQYSEELQPTTLADRIARYALDVQLHKTSQTFLKNYISREMALKQRLTSFAALYSSATSHSPS